MLESAVTRDQLLGPTVVQDCFADFPELKVTIAEVVVKVPVADTVFFDDSLVEGSSLSYPFLPVAAGGIESLLEQRIGLQQERLLGLSPCGGRERKHDMPKQK